METTMRGKASSLPAFGPVLGAVAILGLLLATGCDDKTDDGTAAPAAGARPAPGNPNPNAAANAAAFEAARKKAEGR